jgi:hypothetical protein
MISKKTWIFIAVGIIVLAGIAVSLIFLLGSGEQETGDKAISVSRISSDKVTGMKITEGENVIDLAKKDGVWHFLGDEESRIDQGSMESALTMVCYLYAQQKLFDKVEDLSVYGLDPAAMVVEIGLDDGTSMSFEFGSYTSGRDGVFMKYSGSDALYVYDLDSYSILEKAAKAMRDLTIDINADKLEKIEIMRTSGERVPVTMERIPDDKRVGMESWMLSSPFTAIANGEAVTLVKSFLASPRYSAYAGDTVLDKYGFGSSSAYIYLNGSDGKSVKITVGGRTEDGRYYCTEEGRSGVYELPSGFEALFEIETPNLFPSSVFPVSADQPANVTIEAGDTTYSFVKSGNGFTLNGKKLSDDVTQKLYGYLSGFKFSGVADGVDSLGKPDAVITLENGGNKLIYGFHGYRKDFYAVELNGSGTVSGYVKADHLAVLISAFDEAAKS